MSKLTLLDIAKSNGSDQVVGLIEESIAATPELKLFDSRTIKGTSFKTLIRTSLPSVSFRKVNAGVTPSKSTYANKLVEAFVLSSRLECDKALLAASEDGPEMVKAREGSGVMEAALRTIGSQIFYGLGSDALGFPGLRAICDTAMDIDATGSTASTGSTVWAVKFGPQYCQLVFGQGDAFSLSPWRDETIYDADDKALPGEVADLMGWIGLQCVNKNAVARIRDLTADSGKGLTDALLSQLVNLFPSGIVPDAIFLSRRSRTQLQTARSAVASLQLTGKKGDAGGSAIYAPTPTDFEGIPLVMTDSIINTETLDLV